MGLEVRVNKMGKRIDITGERFGKLVALEYSHTNEAKKAVWKCKCDCGNIHYVTGKDLRSGNTKSCGCTKVQRAKMMKYKDGRTHDRLYNVWETMIKRCENPNCKTYKYYGGKGITVCEEWHDYAKFKEWAMKNGYKKDAPRGETTIDRINNNGMYEPTNCRFVSMKVQAKNKTHNIVPRNKITGRFIKVIKDDTD